MGDRNSSGKPLESVPAFGLYGETEFDVPDQLHCETIAYRSEALGWEIKPHRHPASMQLLYLAEGSVAAQLDGRESELVAPGIILVPVDVVHAFLFSAGVKGHVITLGAHLVQQLVAPLAAGLPSLQMPLVLTVDKAAMQTGALAEQLVREYSHHQPLRGAMLHALTNVLLLTVMRQARQARADDERPPGRREQLLANFQALLEQHYREHRPLPDYAAQLGVTSAQLSRVCRALAGATPLQLAHRRLLLEARRALVYTAMSVAEISDYLGFSEPAYFTRFFTRRCGQAPREFRKQQQQAATVPVNTGVV